jgi:hypothetical protein
MLLISGEVQGVPELIIVQGDLTGKKRKAGSVSIIVKLKSLTHKFNYHANYKKLLRKVQSKQHHFRHIHALVWSQ